MSKNQSDYDIPPKKYNFHEDLKHGKKGEALVESFLGALSGGSFEVKSDRYRNGRMVVEMEQHPRRKMNPDGTELWKPSGLAVTKADWWVYVFTLDAGEGAFLIVSVPRLKRYLHEHRDRLQVVDFAKASSNPSRGYLLMPEDVQDLTINKNYDAIRTNK